MLDHLKPMIIGFSGALLTIVAPEAALTEEATVYGLQLPAAQGGGFRPAGTQLSCSAVSDEGQCWDGKNWHRLFPSGPRQFAHAEGPVVCHVIIKDDPSCWDGSAWYRLPKGTVYGVVQPPQLGGGFMTTPIPPK